MFIRLPLSGDFVLHATHRTASLQTTAGALKKAGPFTARMTLTVGTGWGNQIKEVLGEDPAPFNFAFFRGFLDGTASFRAHQRPDSAKVGWAGELFGLLAFLSTQQLQRASVLRIMQVSGTTTV